MMSSKRIRQVLPLLGGLALIVLLLRQIEPRDVLTLLLNVDVRWLAVGGVWYALTNVLRAFRFGALLEWRGLWRPLTILPEMFAMNFLNNVLPARSGELSFPYFMVTRHKVSFGESATVLILARIFDYLAVACLFVLFAVLELSGLQPNAARVIWAVVVLLAASVGMLLLAPWLANVGFDLAHRLFRTRRNPSGRVNRFLEKAQAQIVPTLRRVRSARTYARALGWSVLVWMAMFACFTAFLQAIRLPQPYALVVVGSTFATLAKALPMLTVGGFGAHEAGWALGFSLTGMDTTLAITSGFAVNILILLTSSLMGGLALLFMHFQRRQAAGDAARGMQSPSLSTAINSSAPARAAAGATVQSQSESSAADSETSLESLFVAENLRTDTKSG